MKKLLALLLALVMLLSFAACSKDEEEKKDNGSSENGEEIEDIEEIEDQFDENSGEKLIEEYRELSEQYVAAYKEDPYSDELTELDRKINEKASEISSYKVYLIGELGDEADAKIDAIEEEILKIATEKVAAISGD